MIDLAAAATRPTARASNIASATIVVTILSVEPPPATLRAVRRKTRIAASASGGSMTIAIRGTASEMRPLLKTCHATVVPTTAKTYSGSPRARRNGTHPHEQIGIYRNPPPLVVLKLLTPPVEHPICRQRRFHSEPIKLDRQNALPFSARHPQRLRTSS